MKKLLMTADMPMKFFLKCRTTAMRPTLVRLGKRKGVCRLVSPALNLPRVTIIICGTAEMWMSHRSSITKL